MSPTIPSKVSFTTEREHQKTLPYAFRKGFDAMTQLMYQELSKACF